MANLGVATTLADVVVVVDIAVGMAHDRGSC